MTSRFCCCCCFELFVCFVSFLLTSRLILVLWMKKPTSGAKQENLSFTAYLNETKISIIIKFLPSTLFPTPFRNNARCSFFALVPFGSSFARRSLRAWKTLFPMSSRWALLSFSPISSVQTGNTRDSGYPTAGLAWRVFRLLTKTHSDQLQLLLIPELIYSFVI